MTFPKRKRVPRKPRITTQKELLSYLDRLKPRYRIRMPLKDKRGPFLVLEKTDVPGTTTQIRESTFEKVLNRGLLRIVCKVDTMYHCYYEYRLKLKRERNGQKKTKTKTANKAKRISGRRKRRTPKIKRKSTSSR